VINVEKIQRILQLSSSYRKESMYPQRRG